jgi:hypothetical protein
LIWIYLYQEVKQKVYFFSFDINLLNFALTKTLKSMIKHLILGLSLLLFFCGKLSISEDEVRENVITTAAQLLGSPYKSGGTQDSGFDCSGFVRFVMSQNNIKISRSSNSQVADGNHIAVETVKPGDILIFKGANKKAHKPGHSGIVHHVQNGIVYFIHSASSKGITIDNLDMQYYKERFIEARDVITPAINNSN